MRTEPLRYEAQDGIATITFDIADRLNPLSEPLQCAFRDALARVRADAAVRVLVLTGAGRAFSVGADLQGVSAEMAAAPTLDKAADRLETLSNGIVLALRALEVPVLSVVNGPAAGGGVGIALAADVVIAARSAFFYMPFMPKLGLVPDFGTTWFLPRAVGPARAMALSLLAPRLSAEKAAQLGLIWDCVDDAALAGEARSLALQLAALPAHAACELRAAYAASERNGLAGQLAYEAGRQRELIGRAEFAEGVRAFAEKRPPSFPGR